MQEKLLKKFGFGTATTLSFPQKGLDLPSPPFLGKSANSSWKKFLKVLNLGLSRYFDFFICQLYLDCPNDDIFYWYGLWMLANQNINI